MAWGGPRPAALSSARGGRAPGLGSCWTERDLWLRSTLGSEQFWRVVPFVVLSGLWADSRAEDWTLPPTHTHTRATVTGTPAFTPGRGLALQLRPGSGSSVTDEDFSHTFLVY